MASTPRPELSAIFDDMLVQNRKRFDDLYRGGRAHPGESVAGAKSAAGGARDTVSLGATPSALLDPASSLAVRRLNERFGNDWRYEIASRQRDGDEAIVLCKLIFGKEGAVRTQFGRAKFSRGPVTGTSGGVRFRLDAGNAEQDERDAFRRATEAALINCIDLVRPD
jgi:hypothetical protein